MWHKASIHAGVIGTIAILALNSSSALAQAPNPYELRKQQANENVITILGSAAMTGYTQFIEDIQNVVDDQSVPNGVRVLPILGRAGVHNAKDVVLLRGVDMAIVELDDIATAKKEDPAIFANAESRIHYITKLANNEFHLIARDDIQSVKDLEGKKIVCMKKNSSTDIACAKIFGALGIKVEQINLDLQDAHVNLRDGKIAAYARYGPAPLKGLIELKPTDGFHFVPIDGDSLPSSGYATLLDTYSPTFLTNEIYQMVPAEKPVPALAGHVMLAVYAWPAGTERYQRLSNFTKRFFDNIDKFKAGARTGARHVKWKEINLAYQVPGLTRFRPAQEWLNAQKAGGNTAETRPAEMRASFEDYVAKKHTQTNWSALSPEQRDAVFTSFVNWQKSQNNTRR